AVSISVIIWKGTEHLFQLFRGGVCPRVVVATARGPGVDVVRPDLAVMEAIPALLKPFDAALLNRVPIRCLSHRDVVLSRCRRSCGEVPERSNGAVSKTVVPLAGDRGFESLPLRHSVCLTSEFRDRRAKSPAFGRACARDRDRRTGRSGTSRLALGVFL